jgi:ribosomal-protein-alanine N-acetyltransferase
VIHLINLGTRIIYTDRCILRRFELRDSLLVFNSYMNDKNIAKYLLNEEHNNVYETELLINEFIKNYNNICYYNWIIIDRVTFNVVGTISLHEVDALNDKVEIGIIISRFYQNKGYAKEVVKEVISFAFNMLKVKRIEAKIMYDNLKSKKLFLSLGFKNEGILYSSVKKNNKYIDISLLSLLNINI